VPTPTSRSHLPGQVLGVVRLAWAVPLLVAPAAVVGRMGGQPDSKSVTVARILGARHAAQAAVELLSWPKWRRAGTFVDAAHSLTAAGFGVADAGRRRVALTDSVIAGTFALCGLGR
jgi:hypothetical protein